MPLRLRSTTSRRSYNLEILLVSMAGLLLEISYTRLVSFKLFYYYTYFVLGIAVLGIGSGGVFVAVSKRLQRTTTATIVRLGGAAAAISVLIGYVVIARMHIATQRIWDYGTGASLTNLARLLALCLALYVSFVAIGVIVSALLARGTEQVGRLYFSDLLGGAIACGVVVSLIGWRGVPATIFLAALVLAVAATASAVRHGGSLVAPVLAVVVTLGTVVVPTALGEPRLDQLKDELEQATPAYSSWSPIFRVDSLELTDRVLLYHDGLSGSAIYPFTGEVESLGRFSTDIRSLPFAVGDRTEDVLIVGAAGGHEILASLYFGATAIDAVELNPVTHDLVTGKYSTYAGDIGRHPSVDYLVDDGRSFLARTDERYDLVWFPAPDSYSATNAANASAFVLSESYLYTAEAIEQSLDRLDPGGILVAQFGEVDFEGKPNRTSRYLSTVRHALQARGITDIGAHVLLATSPLDFGSAATSATILVKNSPFTNDEVDRFRIQAAQVPGTTLLHGGDLEGTDRVSRILTVPDAGLASLHDRHGYAVGPITDDSPFFWHFVTFPDVLQEIAKPIRHADLEAGVGERVLLLLLVVAALLAGVFLLLPFVAVRDTWKALPMKRTSAVYFASIGLGFMFFEITLIQRLTLFLGYPTYSLTVTLAAILLFTGVGAWFSERVAEPRRMAPRLLGGLVLLTVLYLSVLPALTASLLHAPLVLRVAMTFVLLAPLGWCLGMFMPLGLGAVSRLTDHSREYAAWGWAVNGFSSVIGATLTTIVAMTFGFRIVLLIALVAYAVAVVTLRALVAERPQEEAPAVPDDPDRRRYEPATVSG